MQKMTSTLDKTLIQYNCMCSQKKPLLDVLVHYLLLLLKKLLYTFKSFMYMLYVAKPCKSKMTTDSQVKIYVAIVYAKTCILRDLFINSAFNSVVHVYRSIFMIIHLIISSCIKIQYCQHIYLLLIFANCPI